MRRAEPPFPGGPVVADVHRDEVENWIAAGWVAEGTEAKAPPPGGEPELEKMTVAQLRALATERKVRFPANATKDALVASLRRAEQTRA